MLRKVVSAVILIPLAVIIIGFAVANRQIVTVSFDPFDATHPAYALTLPLFAIVFVLVIGGVIVGGIATWLGQGRWRRAGRRAETEARELRAENDALRRQLQGVPQAVPQDAQPPAAATAERRLMLPPAAP